MPKEGNEGMNYHKLSNEEKAEVLKKGGYKVHTTSKGKVKPLHRVIYKEHKPLPPSWHVHHIDGDKNNNDIENLIALPPKLHFKTHQKHGSRRTRRQLEYDLWRFLGPKKSLRKNKFIKPIWDELKTYFRREIVIHDLRAEKANAVDTQTTT